MCRVCRAGLKCDLHPTWLLSESELVDYVMNEAALRILINTDREALV